MTFAIFHAFPSRQNVSGGGMQAVHGSPCLCVDMWCFLTILDDFMSGLCLFSFPLKGGHCRGCS